MPKQCIKSLAISLLCAATVSSCGGSSINVSTGARDCANGFDPAATVDVNIPSFTVDKNLNETALKGFFAAIQPAAQQNGGNSPDPAYQQAANEVGALSLEFINYQPHKTATDYENYTSVRNAMDLLNNEIGTDDIGNFNAGREHLLYCIQQQTPAGYDNGGPYSSTSVTLRDTSTGNDPSIPDANDQAWSFAVNWSYSPNPLGGSPNVTRKLLGFNAISSSMISIYNPQTFNDVGFNQAETTIYGFTQPSYTTNSDPKAKAQLTFNFTQQLAGNNQDTWEMASESTDTSSTPAAPPPLPQSFEGDSNVRCVRVVMHYSSDSVDVYWSDVSPTSANSTPSGQTTSSPTGTTSGTTVSNNTVGPQYQGSCLTDSAQYHMTYDTNPNNYPSRK